MVQVDLNPERIGRNYPVAEGVVADVGAVLRCAAGLAPPAGARDGEAEARAALSARQAEVAAHGFEDERELMRQLETRAARTTPSSSPT